MSARPLLSLCMIVRDSADVLPACLASIRPWVDEIIVVDTGSTDNTREIARSFGAKLYEFPWCDDFSAARNESLRHAKGQWLFWMDADDTIDEINGAKLRELAYGPHDPRTLGYVMQVVCPSRSETGATESTVVDHVKLIRNLPELRFEFRIHEQVLPSIRRLGGETAWTDIFVTHSGSDLSLEGRRRKCDRDLRILALELKDRPGHSFAKFNYGMTYSDMGDHERAAEHLESCLEVASPDETQVRKAYSLLVFSYDQLGATEKALCKCRQGLDYFPDDPELLFRLGKLAHDAGELTTARDAYLRVLCNESGRHFTSIDRGVIGFKAHHNLALVYQDLHQPALAELHWRAALEDQPTFRPAWRMLGQTLVQQQKLTSAEIHVADMQSRPDLRAEQRLVEAELASARGQLDHARGTLKLACQESPEATEALELLCKLEFEQGSPQQALDALRELVKRQPDNAAAHHNRGAVLLRLGRYQEAITAFDDSLRLRPSSEATASLWRLARNSWRDEYAVQERNHNRPRIQSLKAATSSETLQPTTPAHHRTLDVVVVTVGYNLPGATQRMIDTALLECRHRVSFLVFSHASLRSKQQELEQLAERPNVQLFDYGHNRGLAKSWNEGILAAFAQGGQVILVVNEDLQFSAGDLTRLADAAHERQDSFLVMGRCWHEREQRWEASEYGCFAFNRLALDRLGCFDENFFPVYCEDSDYRRRAKLAGLVPSCCDGVSLTHQGSASLSQPEVALQNQSTYAANRAYYARKWGGDADEERFDRPFDDARFSHYIDPIVREAPYPGFDRTDHYLVAI